MKTISDVGNIPGKPPLSDAERRAFADEWNANVAAAEAARNVPRPPSLEERVAALEARLDALGPK